MHAQLILAPLGDQRECRDHKIQWAEHKHQKCDLKSKSKRKEKKKWKSIDSPTNNGEFFFLFELRAKASCRSVSLP